MRGNEQTSYERHPIPSNPRFLIMSSQQTKLASLTPFQRKDGCDRFGKVTRCDRLRDGSIEVEFLSAVDAVKALDAKSFTYSVRSGGQKRDVSIPLTVVPHRTKNFRKGVITCAELRDTSDEEIADGLSNFGVTEARRITFRRGGSIIPTDSVVLTFDATDLPSSVTVGYVRVRVRTYIPNPMRCYRCQRFGHTKTHCRNRPACGKCSSVQHLSEDCEAGTLRCVNCGDSQRPHASYDRTCPAYVKEREINSLKATNNISFREARELYNQTHPSVSYAEKVKTHVSGKTTLEGMTATQLVLLLKSFGLSVVASGATPNSVPGAPTTIVAPPLAAAAVEPSSPSISGDGRNSAAQSEAPSAAVGQDGDDGWTLVQGRRGATRRSEAPPSPACSGEPSGGVKASSDRQSPVKETAVMAALRRSAEEKRARDARRARLVERAREARQSPGSESTPETDSGIVGSAPPLPVGPAGRSPAVLHSPPSMGPPPPQRPRVPPPPLPARSCSGERQPSTPHSAPRPLEPPHAPARPGKRTLAWSGSPSGDGTPRTRYKPQSHPGGGRSSSADGRLVQGDGVHPRIQFRDGAANL